MFIILELSISISRELSSTKRREVSSAKRRPEREPDPEDMWGDPGGPVVKLKQKLKNYLGTFFYKIRNYKMIF